MQVGLPDKAVHYSSGIRYKPFFRKEAAKPSVHIQVQASISISRPAPVIAIGPNEEAAEGDPRGRVVNIIT